MWLRGGVPRSRCSRQRRCSWPLRGCASPHQPRRDLCQGEQDLRCSPETSSCRQSTSGVLHGESSKRLAPPRSTNDRRYLQSTQTTVNRHNTQTIHQALSKGQPRSQDAYPLWCVMASAPSSVQWAHFPAGGAAEYPKFGDH